jgi:hypothetical protein
MAAFKPEWSSKRMSFRYCFTVMFRLGSVTATLTPEANGTAMRAICHDRLDCDGHLLLMIGDPLFEHTVASG